MVNFALVITGRSGYSEDMRNWIKETAQKATAEGKKLLAFSHHPLISPSPFYSLIGKNDMMGGHVVVVVEPEGSLPVVVLGAASRVKTMVYFLVVPFWAVTVMTRVVLPTCRSALLVISL